MEPMLAEEFVDRRGLPLHKKLNKLYRLNKGFQYQNRKLKEELQQFKDEVAQRKLSVLVEAAIEREEQIVKKITPTIKNFVTKKEKHAIVL